MKSENSIFFPKYICLHLSCVSSHIHLFPLLVLIILPPSSCLLFSLLFLLHLGVYLFYNHLSPDRVLTLISEILRKKIVSWPPQGAWKFYIWASLKVYPERKHPVSIQQKYIDQAKSFEGAEWCNNANFTRPWFENLRYLNQETHYLDQLKALICR